MPGTDASDAPTSGTDAADACTSCPASTISWTGSTPTPRRGSTGGGGNVVHSCPPNQVLIGFDGFQARNQVYPWLQSAGGVCGSVAITGTGGSAMVSVTEGLKLQVGGATSGNAWSRRCPTNQVLIGFEGTSATWMGVIGFRCAPLVVSGSGALTTGAVTTLPEVGAPSGSAFPVTDCPAGKIAVGEDLTSSTWLDGFGLLCATVVTSGP
jgi:hypothetical protein